MNHSKFATLIKQTLTLPQVLDFYGFDLGWDNRIPCPFHNGKDRNMSVRDEYFKCFVCGKTGDLISFMMDYFHLDFLSALIKLNEDFHLGLPIGEEKPSLRAIREGERKARIAQRQRILDRIERERLERNREKALDDVILLQQQMDEFQPRDPIEMLFPHGLYINAILCINQALYQLEQAETELYKYEHRRCDNYVDCRPKHSDG